MRRVVAVVAPALLLAACNNTPEGRAERAAAQMNALNNKVLDRAYAEENVLVVRYKAINTRQFSDSEMVKLTSAGMCTLDKVKTFLGEGGAIRMEIPRGGSYLKIAVDRCEGDRAVARNADAKAGGGAQWPTGASIDLN